MCHGHVDVKLLEREALERLRATQPRRAQAATQTGGPPPELMGGLAGGVARLRHALGAMLARLRIARA
jgi:hypothetical protein